MTGHSFLSIESHFQETSISRAHRRTRLSPTHACWKCFPSSHTLNHTFSLKPVQHSQSSFGWQDEHWYTSAFFMWCHRCCILYLWAFQCVLHLFTWAETTYGKKEPCCRNPLSANWMQASGITDRNLWKKKRILFVTCTLQLSEILVFAYPSMWESRHQPWYGTPWADWFKDLA